MKKKTIGIIGCGSIGSAICERIQQTMADSIEGIRLFDKDTVKASSLAARIDSAEALMSPEDVAGSAEMLIEAASPEAAREILKLALKNKRDVMLLSVGGLLGAAELLTKARECGITVILPSGAVAGVDAIKAAKLGGITSVSLTTRKPPASLEGAHYLAERGIDISCIREETVIFEGTADEAVKAFPRNINVSALVSIAGIGAATTKVKIITSPDFSSNTHEINVDSKAGKFSFRTENVPFPSNPKTSYLAALSAMSSLEGYLSGIKIGT